MALLISLNGDAKHDTGVVKGFCRFYKYSARQVWDRAIEEARLSADLDNRVLH